MKRRREGEKGRERRKRKGKRRGKKRGRCAITLPDFFAASRAMGREKRQAIGTQQRNAATRSRPVASNNQKKIPFSQQTLRHGYSRGKKKTLNAKPGTATSQADISRFPLPLRLPMKNCLPAEPGGQLP